MAADPVVRLGFGKQGNRRPDEIPFRLLIIGDFSNSEGAAVPAGRLDAKPAPVDIDTFDALLARLAPRLQLASAEGEAIALTIAEFEDFHPDSLYRRLPVFAPLRDLRRRLSDPATFTDAAAEMRTGAAESSAKARDADGVAAKTPEDDTPLLERLLGAAPLRPATSEPHDPVSAAVARMVGQAVAPHVVGTSEAEQRLYVAAVDDSIARLMRVVLHHPRFQRLEARWRALRWLLSSVDTDEDLQIFVLDVGRDELLADVRGAGRDLTKMALYRLLIEAPVATYGGVPWSLIAADLTFGTGGDDVALAAALTTLAAQAGAPLLAAADPGVLGLQSLADVPDPRSWPPLEETNGKRWQALRRFELASWLGLGLPRVLLRLPYGAKGEPIEAFAFEELTGSGDHANYLWGNPAFAAAILLAQSFSESGWSLSPEDRLELNGLPAFTTVENGETRMKPCAETVLSDRIADAMLELGLMPLLSHPSRPVVRLARFQSIAEPAAELRGPWN